MANTYSFEEAYEASIKYFHGDELAARVWVNKYALKDFLSYNLVTGKEHL